MSNAGIAQTAVVHMHRRKSSRDEDDSVLVFPRAHTPPSSSEPPTSPSNDTIANGHRQLEAPSSPTRSRIASTPAVNGSQPYPDPPPSAGPQRTRFSTGVPRPQSLYDTSESHVPAHRFQPPGMRQSLSLPGNSHARTRSVSGPYSPASPSPLSFSFPPQPPLLNKLSSSSTAPELRSKENGMSPSPSLSSQAQAHARRHSRVHSRNLSVFFPRPGTLPSTAIAEDGGQEIIFDSPQPEGIPMPSASLGPGHRNFREGFTFGARPPSSGNSAQPMSATSSSSNATARRGHHHKHSLSHNFFSFLEPGSQSPNSPVDLHTTPALVPVSPWMPISPFPQTAMDDRGLQTEHARTDLAGPQSPIGKVRATPRVAPEAVGAAVTQFLLGVSLWVIAQQVGSLACTGLGYWVVFDALGVALAHVLPGYLARPSMKVEMRRPFGNARIETVIMFSQSVFLIFASVYVCKETVEHLLLASGEGHHHHNGDEVTEFFGIEFPVVTLALTLVSLFITSVVFNNHSRLVSTAGNYIPPLTSLFPTRYRHIVPYTYPTRLANLLSNPYSLAPVGFCLLLLFGPAFIPPYQHRFFDLVLAGLETVVTFSLAYSAAVALGATLLQTAPARGLAGGRMEAFLRAMREIERHPLVLHLPAPHIWQLTPNLTLPQDHFIYTRHTSSAGETKVQGPAQSLVVTIELHVRRDLEDDEVLRLTKWAWERCSHALHFGSRGGEGGEAEAEVTVGIVKG
ncbi:uncharacterized protein LAESUDRAFT_682098 [Laetiporus sulphureus 93-53]